MLTVDNPFAVYTNDIGWQSEESSLFRETVIKFFAHSPNDYTDERHNFEQESESFYCKISLQREKRQYVTRMQDLVEFSREVPCWDLFLAQMPVSRSCGIYGLMEVNCNSHLWEDIRCRDMSNFDFRGRNSLQANDQRSKPVEKSEWEKNILGLMFFKHRRKMSEDEERDLLWCYYLWGKGHENKFK